MRLESDSIERLGLFRVVDHPHLPDVFPVDVDEVRVIGHLGSRLGLGTGCILDSLHQLFHPGLLLHLLPILLSGVGDFMRD